MATNKKSRKYGQAARWSRKKTVATVPPDVVPLKTEAGVSSTGEAASPPGFAPAREKLADSIFGSILAQLSPGGDGGGGNLYGGDTKMPKQTRESEPTELGSAPRPLESNPEYLEQLGYLWEWITTEAIGQKEVAAGESNRHQLVCASAWLSRASDSASRHTEPEPPLRGAAAPTSHKQRCPDDNERDEQSASLQGPDTASPLASQSTNKSWMDLSTNPYLPASAGLPSIQPTMSMYYHPPALPGMSLPLPFAQDTAWPARDLSADDYTQSLIRTGHSPSYHNSLTSNFDQPLFPAAQVDEYPARMGSHPGGGGSGGNPHSGDAASIPMDAQPMSESDAEFGPKEYLEDCKHLLRRTEKFVALVQGLQSKKDVVKRYTWEISNFWDEYGQYPGLVCWAYKLVTKVSWLTALRAEVDQTVAEMKVVEDKIFVLQQSAQERPMQTITSVKFERGILDRLRETTYRKAAEVDQVVEDLRAKLGQLSAEINQMSSPSLLWASQRLAVSGV